MKNRKIGLLSVSLSMVVCLFAGTYFADKTSPIECGAIPVEVPDTEYNPIFYPADYSTSIVNEPQYATQKSLTFDYMGFDKTPSNYRGDSVKVAVIDSGLNYSHEDFPEINGLSGTIDNKSGTWLYYKYNLGYQSRLNDTLGHGTNVASVIASQINQIGCAGIAPNVDLYIFKVTNDNNGYEWTAINSALQYCIDNDIDVINMSFQAYEHSVTYGSSTIGASTGCSTTMTTMINKCYNAGITLVGAAGNYNTNEPSYPASNNHVISVGSLAENSTSAKAGFSNTYGIDLVAPGYVYVADKGSTSSYKKTSGTSFSAPIVTAAIALYKQKHQNASPSEIESALYNSCDEISGNPAWAGNGRLNIDRFLGLDENSPQSISIISPSSDTLELQVGETYQLQYSVEPNTFTGDVEFTTYETGAISVSSSGLITALAEGEDTVSINPVGFANINDEIDVTVVPKASTVVETLSDSKTVSFSGSKEGTWEISPQTTYCGLYYSGKNSSATITNKSINEFSNFATSTESSLTVYVDGICNSGTNSVKVSTIDSSGIVIETANALTGKLGSGSNSSNAKSAGPFTFTPSTAVSGLQIVIGAKCCVTKISYSYSYTKEVTGGGTTKTLSSISITDQKASFTVGETWSFGGTVTANYSDNSHADVTEVVTFSGNSTSTTGTKTVTVSYTEGDVTKTATYNITVSAQAVTNYTVTFDSNGGSGTMTSKTTNGSSYVTPTCSFTKEDYTFDKWALNSKTGTKYSVGETINNISSNITLYAIWTEKSSSSDNFNGYYDSINEDSTTLLADLRSLNIKKRQNPISYGNLNQYFKYTDYDPNGATLNSDGQPYNDKLLSFYSGDVITSSSSYNKEHVWPNSRGGGSDKGRSGSPYVEDDLFMPRPTLTSENSDRGNSSFVEGMSHASNGWDPVTAFDKTYTSIRGECARIIFYCMTVNANLRIVDDANTDFDGVGGRVTIGKLSDLLRWNLQNPVNDREIRRQSGGQYIQKNRNAFVDHPEYACKIWGNTSDVTRQICSMDPVTNKELVDLEVSGTLTKTSFYSGESFSPTGLTINAIFDDNSSLPVTNLVTWSPTKLTTDTTSVTGSYTLNGVTKTVTIDGFTVTASPTSSLTKVTSMSQLSDGDLVYLATGLNDTDVGVTGQNGSNDATVSSSVSSWKQYTVVKSGTTYKLKDGTQYIGTVTSNAFKYDTTGASITLDSSSNMKVGSRWFVKNGSNYRCYTSLGTYIPFHIYKVPVQTDPKVTNITLDPTSLSFDVYNDMNSKTIIATVTADEGADKTILWSSSDPSVATVENGVVTPHAEGSATITAKAGTITKTCSVTVNDSTPAAVSGVTLNKGSTSLIIGSSETLIATVNPSNAGNKNVTWSTNNASVATVSNGTVNAIAAGTATITVTTEEGGFTDSCTVTVTAAPVITYQLEADQETVPYMSGTNHQVSVGVKLYQYSNGVKGSKIASSTGSVDTSVLGPAKISYTYQSVTYETSVKVTNNGAIQNIEGTSTNKSSTFTKSIFTKNETQKVGDLSLTLQNNGGYYGYESTKGQQIGSGSNPAKSMSLTTSVEGTITKVIINTSGGSSVSATVSVRVGSTSFKCGTSTSKSISATATNYEFTGSASGDIVISWSQTSSKALYFKSIEITTTTAGTKVFSNEEQAGAWADYFIKLTGGGEFDGPCKLGTPEAKKAALQQVWGELKSEYVYMVEGSKAAFCSTDATETIAEAVQHYRYIVNTYGLEDFAEVPQVSSSNKLIPISDSEPFIIGVIAMAGLAAIGGYFVFRRRREE